MCGILAVLGVADVSLAKRSRIIELSRRYGAAPHCLAVPSPSVPFVWLKRGPAPPPRPGPGRVIGLLRPFEERAEEIWWRVGIVEYIQHLWANGISLVFRTLQSTCRFNLY